jgi:hypothetical protein
MINGERMNNEIIIYQSEELSAKIEVKVVNETVWLNRQQISTLFERDVKTIGKHITNVFAEGELESFSTVANFATVQNEGGRKVERQIEYYNLDVIISVGYRIKSPRGTQFRIWANKILKEYLLKGHIADRRITFLENEMRDVKTRLNEIDFQIKTNLPQNEGVFYNGQVFDAYIFVSDLIKTAKNTIVLIDNYVDDSVLTMLSKRNKNVSATIYTSKISKQLSLDLYKHNQQYQEIIIKTFPLAHDRFLILDNHIIYHIGASFKDLGKKLFAFSKINIDAINFIQKLDGTNFNYDS